MAASVMKRVALRVGDDLVFLQEGEYDYRYEVYSGICEVCNRQKLCKVKRDETIQDFTQMLCDNCGTYRDHLTNNRGVPLLTGPQKA